MALAVSLLVSVSFRMPSTSAKSGLLSIYVGAKLRTPHGG